MFLRHEDLSADPSNGFQAICRHTGIVLSDAIAGMVRRSTSPENPIDAPRGVAHAVMRDSRRMARSWRYEWTLARLRACGRRSRTSRPGSIPTRSGWNETVDGARIRTGGTAGSTRTAQRRPWAAYVHSALDRLLRPGRWTTGSRPRCTGALHMMPCGDREASGFIDGRIRSCRAVAQRRLTPLAERAEASQLNRLD